MLEDRLALENIASPELIEKFKDSIISKGQAFEDIGDKVEYDKELESMFDEPTKLLINKLVKSIIIV